jgi:hypothetical protein
MLQKHPNEFTRRVINKYFADRQMPVQVNAVRDGYVVLLNHFSVVEACNVDEASGRLVHSEGRGEWKLYWMSGNFRWHLYEQCSTLHQALNVMLSEEAANHFRKVL